MVAPLDRPVRVRIGVHTGEGRLANDGTDFDTAMTRAREALDRMPERVGGSTLAVLGMIAILQAEGGDIELAARLTGSIAAIQAETGEALAPVTTLHLPHPESIVRSRLSASKADRLTAEGRTLSIEKAVSLVGG